MGVRIRELEVDDFERWKPLWEGYLAFYEHPVQLSQINELWERLLIDDPEIVLFRRC